MPRRITALLVAVAGLCLVAAAPASALQRIDIVGKQVLKPGQFYKDTQRFAPRNVTVDSGEKVRVRNRAKSEEPHTLSLVKRRQLPDSFDCPACGQIEASHEVNPETGEPGKPVVNVGSAGFDQPGDSIIINPGGDKVSFDVTADAGKTLYYLCIIHPWMQGKIRVK